MFPPQRESRAARDGGVYEHHPEVDERKHHAWASLFLFHEECLHGPRPHRKELRIRWRIGRWRPRFDPALVQGRISSATAVEGPRPAARSSVLTARASILARDPPLGSRTEETYRRRDPYLTSRIGRGSGQGLPGGRDRLIDKQACHPPRLKAHFRRSRPSPEGPALTLAPGNLLETPSSEEYFLGGVRFQAAVQEAGRTKA